jgi:hypothetical protein
MGVDFSCAPTPRKAITVAHGRLLASASSWVQLDSLDELTSLEAFEALVQGRGPWLGAFDFPFGLPRLFVEENHLGTDCDQVIQRLHARCPTRMAFRALVDAWTNPRPAGHKLVHRATDQGMQGVSSTSPLQTRYVPVGLMYYEGLSRLVKANVSLPGLRKGRPDAVAVEGYPALLAHELIGRESYKNTDDAPRRAARERIVAALQAGKTHLGLTLKVSAKNANAMLDDPSGDLLDAALCLMQAAWSSQQPRHGQPKGVDPVEGWIATA